MESAMTLQTGIWVKAERGEVGKIVPISRLTVLMQVPATTKSNRVEAF